jgi:AcrR family transcriptional regulator
MSAKSRREEQKAELRGMILEAAREVFVREGHEQVSMRKLAEKIEYSPGTIYLHFSSKEDLLNCLVEESFGRLAETLEKTRRDDPVETLRCGLRAYVNFGLRHPNHYHFAFMVRPEANRSDYKPHRAFEYLRQCVRDCIEANRFRPVDPETTAQLLWATVHGITSLLVTRPGFPWVGRSKLVQETIDNSIRGLLVK